MEGLATFKYLWRPLDHTDNGWPEIRQNIKRARTVWGRLEKLLRRERAEPRVVTIFYRAVAQAVILFGLETSVLPAGM